MYAVFLCVWFQSCLSLVYKFKPFIILHFPLNSRRPIYTPCNIYESRRYDWTPAAFMHVSCRVFLYSSFCIQQENVDMLVSRVRWLCETGKAPCQQLDEHNSVGFLRFKRHNARAPNMQWTARDLTCMRYDILIV